MPNILYNKRNFYISIIFFLYNAVRFPNESFATLHTRAVCRAVVDDLRVGQHRRIRIIHIPWSIKKKKNP